MYNIISISSPGVFGFCRLFDLYLYYSYGKSVYIASKEVNNTVQNLTKYQSFSFSKCIKGLLWAPMKQKLKAAFSQISTCCFIRTIVHV